MDCATRTIDADSRFAKEIKLRFGTKLIFCGPHPTTFPEEVSEYADHVVLREYELVVLDILQGKDLNEIPGTVSEHQPETATGCQQSSLSGGR